AQLFVEKTIFDGEGTLQALLTSPSTWVNPALAKLYGVAAPSPEPSMGDFGAVTLDPSRRGGLLTLPIFLASQAHPVQGSPVLRGNFVIERFFRSPPPAPPPNVDVSPPVAGGAAPKTNRQRYAALADNAPCTTCHARMNGFGFPFESFDAMGGFRTT